MQGEELNTADYVALAAPAGGAVASSILKRALPALKALKSAGRTKEAIKLEQEIAGDIAQALNSPAGVPKAPGSRFASGAGPDLRTSTRAGSEVASDTIADLGADTRVSGSGAFARGTFQDTQQIPITRVDLGRAGIRDTQIYGGPPAGVRDTQFQTMNNIAGRGPTRLDTRTMPQAMYRPENVNMATSAGELVPLTGTRTSIGRLATGLDEGTMPGQLATRIDESTMPGRLATRIDTATRMDTPMNVPVNLTPSSFVSGRSSPLRQPQQSATPFNTDPVGQARRIPSAPRDTIVEEGLPAGITDTIADGIPAALRRDPAVRSYSAPKAIALGGAAGATGALGLRAATGTGIFSQEQNDDAVQASSIPQPQTPAVSRRVADASPGSYKLRSGDTVMDLVKTVTSNKKKQKQLLSEIVALNPEILKEEAFQAPMMDKPASPEMIDPSRVKAGESLVLPEGVGAKLKASETALASRRAANMKTRKKRASQKSDDISNFRNEVIDMRPADLKIEIPEDPIEAMSYDEKEAFDREYAGMGMAYGGKVPDMKGYMFGGSVGSTDTVPAMLTPGEHVIDRPNAEYIRQNPSDMRNLRRLARDIQDGVPSNPPVVQGYAAGGKVAKKTDPSKWEQAKRDAKAKMGGKHSARAMQLATQLYKKRGGGYKGSKPSGKSNSLKKWGAQKWKWSGGDKKGPGGKGVYLPSKKVDKLKSTAKGKMKLAVASAKKAKATREGKQYSKHGLASGVKGYEKGGKVLERIGVSGYNKPKRTPNHPTKSHVVVAKKGDTVKTIRFGQQGVRGAGKNPKSAKDKARKKSYYARHNAQDASPDKLSARYWSHKVKW